MWRMHSPNKSDQLLPSMLQSGQHSHKHSFDLWLFQTWSMLKSTLYTQVLGKAKKCVCKKGLVLPGVENMGHVVWHDSLTNLQLRSCSLRGSQTERQRRPRQQGIQPKAHISLDRTTRRVSSTNRGDQSLFTSEHSSPTPSVCQALSSRRRLQAAAWSLGGWVN